MDSDWFGSVTGLPEKFIRFQIEVDKRLGYFSLIMDVNLRWWRIPALNSFCPGYNIHSWKGTLILIDILIQCLPPCSTSSQPSPSLEISQPSLLNWESIHGKSCLATSSGRKSGCPTILRRFWKLNCDFFSPSFQYHSPSKNEDWLGYRE